MWLTTVIVVRAFAHSGLALGFSSGRLVSLLRSGSRFGRIPGRVWKRRRKGGDEVDHIRRVQYLNLEARIKMKNSILSLISQIFSYRITNPK